MLFRSQASSRNPEPIVSFTSNSHHRCRSMPTSQTLDGSMRLFVGLISEDQGCQASSLPELFGHYVDGLVWLYCPLVSLDLVMGRSQPLSDNSRPRGRVGQRSYTFPVQRQGLSFTTSTALFCKIFVCIGRWRGIRVLYVLPPCTPRDLTFSSRTPIAYSRLHYTVCRPRHLEQRWRHVKSIRTD